MSLIPKPYEVYKHFKGNLYQIVAVARHSETGEQLVVYRALYGDAEVYARPLEMFLGKVDKEKYPEASQTFRFELQGANGREDGNEAKEVRTAALGSEGEEAHLDPVLVEFLDADSYAQRLNILTGLCHRITDDMITTMAIACDVEVAEGDTRKRYDSLRSCLLTLEKYECNRLK